MAKKIVYIDNFLSAHGSTPTTGVTVTQLLTNEGYTVVRSGTKKNKAARLFEMLGSVIKNRNAVILIATYSTSAFYFAWAAAQLCRLFQITYIPCLHGGNLPERVKANPGLSAQVFAHGYTNVVVSGYLQQCMKDNNWQCRLVPNSININNYPFLHRVSAGPRLLWVRSFHKIYNPQLAIRLVHGLLETYADVTLTMVGPDKDGSLDQCKKLAEDLGVGGHIHYTGRLTVAEWTNLSALHDIFINTTNFDNLPVSVIEAMALGMPVISTEVGGLKYLIANGANGFLVPPDNMEAFKTQVEYLMNNPTVVANISNEARKEAESYSEDVVMQQWKALLNNTR